MAKLEGIAYLVIEKDKRLKGNVRVVLSRRTRPDIYAGQMAVKVKITVDEEVFDKIPTANLDINKDEIIMPEIDFEAQVD